MKSFLIELLKVSSVVLLGIVILILLGSWSHHRARRPSRATALVQDGRILGNSAQQYFYSTGQKSISFTYNPITGEITGPLTTWVKTIGKGYTIPDTTIELGNPAAFTLSDPKVLNGQPITFSDEGKTTMETNR